MKIFGLVVTTRRRYDRFFNEVLDVGREAGRLEARYGARSLAVVNGVWGSRPEAARPVPGVGVGRRKVGATRGGQHRRRRGHLRLVAD